MSNAELKKKILEVIEQQKLAAVATIKDGNPWVRYMVIQADDDLTCYTTAFSCSRKIEQIKKNKNVHITIGGDPHNWELPYINMVATASVLTDPETKKKCWNDALGQFFSGPDDPKYAVIKISPEVIEYCEPGKMEPEIFTPQ